MRTTLCSCPRLRKEIRGTPLDALVGLAGTVCPPLPDLFGGPVAVPRDHCYVCPDSQ